MTENQNKNQKTKQKQNQTANRPDIVVKDKKERTCLLIGMSIPKERNTSLKIIEKLSKYKDLEIELRKHGE